MNIRVPVAVSKAACGSARSSRRSPARKPRAHAGARLRPRPREISGDLSKMNGPEFDQFLNSLDDVNIEIDDGKSQVRITCE